MDSTAPEIFRTYCPTRRFLIFAEVLYPKDICDLIDFHVRECVKREVRMRVCKNCLRCFDVTGKAGTEYCDRVCDSGAITPEEFSRWLKES